MTLELNHQEVETLQELISNRLRDLVVEIHRTDSPAYRHKLETMNDTLIALQAKLEGASVAA